MAEYTSLLIAELRCRTQYLPNKNLSSIYFGGGTPSLLPMDLMVVLMDEIVNLGFIINPETEVTIEINPGTITSKSLDLYLAAGVNRFSVGAQTFNDKSLAACGREHNADHTDSTLKILMSLNCNFSLDLLFGLPNQNRKDLSQDLDRLTAYRPKHVSLYNLTVPNHHAMNRNRASDEDQAEMFRDIEDALATIGVKRYELSNFSVPGQESKHNQIYWSDIGYLGVGISAHSYLPDHGGPFGTRFWNSRSSDVYSQQILDLAKSTAPDLLATFPSTQMERLKMNESMTDYCHTHLRMVRGLNLETFKIKFGDKAFKLLKVRLNSLLSKNLVREENNQISFTSEGWPIANQIFLELTFLPSEI